MINAPTLREAAKALVARLDECEPHISALVMRAGQYTGPYYGVELDALKATLSAQVPEDDARPVEVLRTRLNRLRDSQDLPVGDGAGARVAVNLHALADVLISAHEAADRIEALGSPVRS